MRALDRDIGDHPPRLFDSGLLTDAAREQKLAEAILPVFSSAADLVKTDDLRKVRAAVEACTNTPVRNIVSQSLCRAGWYVMSVVVSLLCLMWWSELRFWRLPIAMLAYLSVGLTFGLIFYDYFLLDAGRYHFLMQAMHDWEANIERLGPEELQKLPPQWKTFHEAFNEPSGHRRMLQMVQSGFFASSVFAQDTPQLAVDNDLPLDTERVVAGSFQFDPEEKIITGERPLAFYYILPPEGSARTEASRRVLVKSVPSNKKLASVGASLPKRADDSAECQKAVVDSLHLSSAVPGTNDESRVRLVHALCQEAVAVPLSAMRSYQVAVAGAADCSGDDERNTALSGIREGAALDEARRLVALVASTRSSMNLPYPLTNIRRLQAAARVPHREQFAERKRTHQACADSSFESTLWPESIRVTPRSKPLRAAVVDISRISVNYDDHIHMSSGLTRNTTLTDMIYFSFVSFTTTGYGDIKAVSGPVRFCVIMENILEILFTAVFFTAAMSSR